MIKATSVSSTAVRLATPGPACKVLVLQNNGAVNIRLSLDGNTDNTLNGAPVGTAPTTTTGMRLAAGTQFVMTLAQYPNMIQRNIWAISEGAAVTIDVITDDKDSV